MDPTSHDRVPRASRRRALRSLAGVGLLASVLLQVACVSRGESAGDPVRPGAAGDTAEDGLAYSGDLAVLESFPVQLVPHVVVRNTSQEERSLTFPDGCVVLLRAYVGERLVWDQSRQVGCTMALQTVTVARGGSRRLSGATVSAYEVLGDSLPDGTYRMAAYLRPDLGDVEVSLGEVSLAVPR
ncbi:MAG: hypothetical protein ABR599_12530 [Gemmatimonadota bacterium]